MNAGEKNELLVKMRLVQLRDSNAVLNIFGNNKVINSVGFKGIEYRPLPTNLVDLKMLTERQISDISAEMGIGKAALFDKADVFINGEGYSLKSLETAPPAIINHTARPGWERVCRVVGCNINELDDIVAKYWELRKGGIIKEDSHNSDSTSPFKDHKTYLLPILNYFTFKGSATKESPSPAKFILDVSNPLDISTWTFYDERFLDLMWDKLIFSIRAKKGMKNYPNISDVAEKESMNKWTEMFQGEYRGALHIRLGK